ncbi:E3 ubiquitin/ISG15 ligase TRIM25-like [Clupea harengus]|uniref:E3 ubiquitin/ISG15 ligase TRIM25-like n=1 Tax=Clupea harengus TaxID=7950 RepID=A0A6P8FLH4_CLUHA|nr:E3 ubiquitin/ISG15 ligase TRIM25-like [Clupea harengus]
MSILVVGAGYAEMKLMDLPPCELTSRLLTEDLFRCSICKEVLKDPVSIPCGHSYSRQCISSYWEQHNQEGVYVCPQCPQAYSTRPELYINGVAVQMLQKAKFSPFLPARSYAGPGEVACDFCTGRKLRAVKSCLTCIASYCENHIRPHYTVPVLQKHRCVEATRKLDVFSETDQSLICSWSALLGHNSHDPEIVVSVEPPMPTHHQGNTHGKLPFPTDDEPTIWVSVLQILCMQPLVL